MPMQKIYTIDLKTSPKNNDKANGLKTDVLNNILSFSKSLEVLKSKDPQRGKKSVEIVLN